MLLLASVAWAGVVYARGWMIETAAARGASALSAEQRAGEAAFRSRVHTIALDTAPARETLESVMRSDITDFADTIEATGKSVGVSVRVKAALPVGNSDEIVGGDSLHTLAFIVQAEGSFAGLVRFEKTLESFPAFASVQQFEFERVQSVEKNAPPWRSTIRLHVITTSDIAS
jgi:hypothetical protein